MCVHTSLQPNKGHGQLSIRYNWKPTLYYCKFHKIIDKLKVTYSAVFLACP